MNAKEFELPCYDRKSFYGKAIVKEYPNGCKELKSYSTIVCKIDEKGNFIKLWNDYSVTTMRHINAFLKFYCINGGGKSWWTNLERK